MWQQCKETQGPWLSPAPTTFVLTVRDTFVHPSTQQCPSVRWRTQQGPESQLVAQRGLADLQKSSQHGPCRVWQHVFSKQSPPPILCHSLHIGRVLLSQNYGGILPSSFQHGFLSLSMCKCSQCSNVVDNKNAMSSLVGIV